MAYNNTTQLSGNRHFSIVGDRVLGGREELSRVQPRRSNGDAARGNSDRAARHHDLANVKSVFFLMFLFAVGYGVGPQFVRGIAKDGLPQALFAVIQCAAVSRGSLSSGEARRLRASARRRDSSRARRPFRPRWDLPLTPSTASGSLPTRRKRCSNAMPTAYAVTYIFGTIGSAMILAMLGPKLLGIDLVAACKEYEATLGGRRRLGGAGQAWHQYELRAYRVPEQGPDRRHDGGAGRKRETPEGARLFIERIRRGGAVQDAKIDDVLQCGRRGRDRRAPRAARGGTGGTGC